MSTPILLLIVPLAAGVAAYLLRRWQPAAAAIGMGAMLIMAILMATTKGDVQGLEQGSESFFESSWIILSQSLVLDQLSRNVLFIVYGGISLIILLSLVLRQDSLFIPVSLLALSPLAGAMMAESISIGATFLLIGAAVLAILIQGDKLGSTLTAFRYLTLAALAFPILLAIGWMLETSPAQFLSWTTFLLLVLFIILLFSFPFHIWVPPTISESKSLVPVVVFGLAQLVVVTFLFKLIAGNPILYGNARLLQLLQASGAATLILAAALLLTAPSISRLLGYLLLIDLGSTAIALGLGGKIGLEMAGYLVMIRIGSLLMAGIGLGMIRRHFTTTMGDSYQSFKVETLARRSPLGLALIIYGGLSLAGLPLTPGFAGRWSLVNLTGGQDQWIAPIIVIAVLAAAVGLARMFFPNPSLVEDVSGSDAEETRALRTCAAILLAIGVLFALFSPLLLSLSQKMVNSL